MGRRSGRSLDRFVVLLGDHDARLPDLPFAPTHLINALPNAAADPAAPRLVAQVGTQLTCLRIRERTLVLIGPGRLRPAERDRLSLALGRSDHRTAVDRELRLLPSAWHVVTLTPTTATVRGTATDLRQVHIGRRGQRLVISDRADLVAGLVSAPLDAQVLASWLLEPGRHGSSGRTMWAGVRHVPAGSEVVAQRCGRYEERPWWTAPEEPAGEGTDSDAALRSAIAHAIDGHECVTSELSGGPYSTAITEAALACADPTQRLFALTATDHGETADLQRARHFAAGQPALDHDLTAAGPGRPSWPPILVTRLDEPSLLLCGSALQIALSRLARRVGSGVHLTGRRDGLSDPAIASTGPTRRPWISADTQLFRADPEEFSDQALDRVRRGARDLRALAEFVGGTGVVLAAPFFDDRVVEARWPAAVHRPASRRNAAVSDVGTLQLGSAYGDLWSDSRLARLGLIDVAALRDLGAEGHVSCSLASTVAAELWLRSLEAARPTRIQEITGRILRPAEIDQSEEKTVQRRIPAPVMIMGSLG